MNAHWFCVSFYLLFEFIISLIPDFDKAQGIRCWIFNVGRRRQAVSSEASSKTTPSTTIFIFSWSIYVAHRAHSTWRQFSPEVKSNCRQNTIKSSITKMYDTNLYKYDIL